MLAALLCLLAGQAISAPDAHAGRLEAGVFTAHDTLGTNRTPDRVNFQQTFDTPPIVIALGSSAGANSASVRITNVTTTGFDELILEPDNWDGRHLAMETYYIAVEPGRHVLPDGTIIEAGTTTTTATQFGTGFTGGVASWATVNFSSALAGTPTVLHNLQTANSETRDVANQSSRPHITSVIQSFSATGFQLAIDRSQANSGPFPSAETIGWVAFPAGGTGTFPDTSGTNVTWSAVNSAANVRGWDDGCFTNGFGQTSGSRIAVAKKISRNNPDGGWFRWCSLNSTTIGVRVDEDRDQDNERNITTAQAEQAGIIAFSRAFHADLSASLSVTKTRSSILDPSGGDFATPSSIADYLITVTNSGNAPPNYDSVIITETLPGDMALVISDYAGPGSGPVPFTDGSPPSGLTCTFVSLASASDCLSFSTDGLSYAYTPVDSGDGADPAVTHVRIQPAGFMAADTGAGPSQFSLRLRGRIK